MGIRACSGHSKGNAMAADVHRMQLPTGAKKAIQRVLREGWTLEHGRKHYKLRRPETMGGGMIIIGTSTSSGYAETLVVKGIERLEKGLYHGR